MNIDQIAVDAARQISFNWARTTQQDIEDIIKASIEKATKAAYIQGYNDCDCELNGRAAHASEQENP